MNLNGKKIGFALTGSHCTIKKIETQLINLKQEGVEIYPIFSTSVNSTPTRFGNVESWTKMFSRVSSQPIIATITDAEPIGPQGILDVMVVAPCSGNTLAKLANGITDTAVLMAVKAHLRNQKPVVLAISTNDGLGLNARNLGTLLITKNIFMVPFGQDSPNNKANSLVANMELIVDTIKAALEGKQIQPLLLVP